MTPPCAILFVKMKGELLMKLFIGSDIHGSSANIRRFLDIVADARKDSPDVKVVLLGDIYNHGPRNPFPEGYAPMQVAKMLNDSKDFIRVIKGNCDSEVDQMISEFPIESDFRLIGKDAPYFSHTVISAIPTFRLRMQKTEILSFTDISTELCFKSKTA